MSSTLIAVIVSLVIGIFMLISFFIGRKRGVKRTVLSFGISLIMFIAAFFLTPVFTNLILGISFEYEGVTATVGTIVSAYLSGDQDFGKYIQNSSSVTSFINGIIPAILSVLIFAIVYLVFRLIGYIIYVICAKFAFKSKKQEEEEGIFRNKLGGGLISAAKTFIFFVLLALPFTSLTHFVESSFFPNYTEKVAEASEEVDLPSPEQISNQIPSVVKRVIAGYNNSIIGFSGHVFGLDNIAFDYLSKIDIKGTPVYLRQTAEAAIKLYDYGVDVYKDYKNDSTDFFKNMDYETFDQYKKDFLQSGIIKDFVFNVVCDYVENYDKVLPEEFVLNNKELLDGVKTTLSKSEKPNELLLNDFDKLLGILKSAGQSGILDDAIKLSNEDKLKELPFVLADDYTDTFVSEVIDSVFNVTLVKENFEIIADKVLSSVGESEVVSILQSGSYDIKDWDKFVFDIKDILTDVGNLYDYIENAGISVEDFTSDIYLILKADSTKINLALRSIGGILDKVDNLEMLKSKDNTKLLNSIFDKLGAGDLLKDVVINAGETLNYSYLFDKLGSSVSNLIEFDLYDEVKSGDFSSVVCKIADKMASETEVDGVKLSQKKLEDIFENVYKFPRIKELTIDAFKEELSSIVDLSVFDNDTTRSRELRYMTQILIVLAENKVGTGETNPTFLKYILTEGNTFDQLLNWIDTAKTKEIFDPIFKSQMTTKICDEIFSEVSSTLTSVAGENIEVKPTKDQLINECDEICNIFAQFINIYQTGKIENIDSVEKVKLGKLLDLIKINAYRGEGFSKRGVFKQAFDKLIAKAENDYSVDFKKVTGKTYIYEVEFEKVCRVVDLIEKENGVFEDAIKPLLSGEEITQTKLENMLNSINSTNEYKVLEILQTAYDCGVSIDAQGTAIEIGGETKTVYDLIDSYEYNSTITQLDLIKLGLKGVIKG